MRGRGLGLAVVVVVLAGCSAPPPPAPLPPSPPPSTDEGRGGNATGGAPRLLVNGEDAHLRVDLVDHRVAGGEVTLVLDVRNKDAEGWKGFGYALLAHARGDSYVDLPGRVDAGQVARFSARGTDDEGELRSAWTNVTLYYQEHPPGAEYSSDEAVVLDLRGRGLPSNVAD